MTVILRKTDEIEKMYAEVTKTFQPGDIVTIHIQKKGDYEELVKTLEEEGIIVSFDVE